MTESGQSGFADANVERFVLCSNNPCSTGGLNHAVADHLKIEKVSIPRMECLGRGFTIFGCRCVEDAIAKAESMASDMLTEESPFAMNGTIHLKRSMSGL